jgi:hypothetical protein
MKDGSFSTRCRPIWLHHGCWRFSLTARAERGRNPHLDLSVILRKRTRDTQSCESEQQTRIFGLLKRPYPPKALSPAKHSSVIIGLSVNGLISVTNCDTATQRNQRLALNVLLGAQASLFKHTASHLRLTRQGSFELSPRSSTGSP